MTPYPHFTIFITPRRTNFEIELKKITFSYLFINIIKERKNHFKNEIQKSLKLIPHRRFNDNLYFAHLKK